MNNLLRLIAVVGLVACAVLAIGLGMARNTADLLAPFHQFLFVIAVVLYLLPTALAYCRDCKVAVYIAVVNVFLGWTLFGWVVAIGWAASGNTRPLPPTIPAPPKHALQGH